MRVLVTREDTNDRAVSIMLPGGEYIYNETIQLDRYYQDDFCLVVEEMLLPQQFDSWRFVCNLSEGAFRDHQAWKDIHKAQDAAAPEFAGEWPETGLVYDVQAYE